jgi:hypothetical protein
MSPKPVLIVLLTGVAAALAPGQSNIDQTNRHAWGENIGWTNWRDANEANAGVVVRATFVSGYAWAENTGWINLGDGSPANGVRYLNLNGLDSGVNVARSGDLHGLAWGENVGWINFDGGAMATPPLPARIECAPGPNGETLSRLTGYVWGENIGWINLDDTMHFVSVDVDTTPIDCDMNHDGLPDGLDVQLFVDFVLANAQPNWMDVCSGDLEMPPDGSIDLDDVADFVACLLAP